MKNEFETALLEAGYIPTGLGFTKTTAGSFQGEEFITHHWVTLFYTIPTPKVQIWAYYDEHPDDDSKLYNTGLVSMTVDQLKTFIQVLVK